MTASCALPSTVDILTSYLLLWSSEDSRQEFDWILVKLHSSSSRSHISGCPSSGRPSSDFETAKLHVWVKVHGRSRLPVTRSASLLSESAFKLSPLQTLRRLFLRRLSFHPSDSLKFVFGHGSRGQIALPAVEKLARQLLTQHYVASFLDSSLIYLSTSSIISHLSSKTAR